MEVNKIIKEAIIQALANVYLEDDFIIDLEKLKKLENSNKIEEEIKKLIKK